MPFSFGASQILSFSHLTPYTINIILNYPRLTKQMYANVLGYLKPLSALFVIAVSLFVILLHVTIIIVKCAQTFTVVYCIEKSYGHSNVFIEASN